MNDDELITLMKEPFADVHMTMPLDQVVRHGGVVRARRRRLRGLTGAVALTGAAVAAVALLVPGGSPAKEQLAAWIVTRDPDGGVTVTVNQMKDPGGLQATLRADGIPARVTFNPVNAMNKPLPTGCTAPNMSGQANAQMLNKILTPPAIWAWMQQQQEERRLHPPKVYVTYWVHGHIEHATLLATPDFQRKLEQFLKEHHADPPSRSRPGAQISGFGDSQMPSSLQTVFAKEQLDLVGRTALYINPVAIPAGIGLYIGVDVASSSSFNFGEDLVVTSSQCTGS